MPLLRQLLDIEPLIALFVTIGFGYLMGKIRTGTLLMGALIGQIDFQPKTAPTPRSSK